MQSKNYAVEFYRFLFCVIIILFHAENSTGLQTHYFQFGYYCVEFYFILSGFLFMKSVEKQEKTGNRLGMGNLQRFLIYRVKKFAAPYYVSLFLTLIYRLYIYKFCGNFTYAQLREYVASSLPEFFMLSGVFYHDNHTNGPVWYISAMIIAESILFVLLIYVKNRKNRMYAFGAVSLFFLYLYYGKRSWFGVGYNIVRAIGEITLGMLIYTIYQYTYDKISKHRYLCLLAETACIINVFLLLFSETVYFSRALVIIPFAIWIYIIFCKNTILDRLLSNKFSKVLGRISLPCYLLQMLVLVKFGWNPLYDVSIHPWFSFSAILCVDIFLAIVMEFALLGCKTYQSGNRRAELN